MSDVLEDAARRILDALPEAVLVVDGGGRVRYLNDVAGELLGYRRVELEGVDVATVIASQPGQRVDVVAWLARWADEPNSPQLRYLTLTGRTRSGAQLRLSVRVARLDSERGRYLVTLRDVTAEQREHQDVKHAHLVASRILSISDDAIVNADKDSNVTFFNRKAETLFGRAAADVVGRPIEALLPERYRREHGRHVAAFRDAKSPSRLMGERGEIVGLAANGEEIPLEASITKVFIDGEPIFSVQLRDIRPRKAAERARAASEQRFRTIFEHAMEAIALIDPSGSVLELNAAARALLGGATGAIGRKFWLLPWWPRLADAAERERREHAMQDAIARCARGEEIRTRAELVDLRGERRVIDFSLRPVWESAGAERAVASIVAEGRDITQLVPPN
jgi:PAS domain S-box-containing protein